MDILFSKEREKELANDGAKLRRAFRGNQRRPKLIRARLDELADADDLQIMWSIPQSGFHNLVGNRKGQFAVKLDKGYRMTLEPANDPLPLKPDGGLDLELITAIRILKLAEDYHVRKSRK